MNGRMEGWKEPIHPTIHPSNPFSDSRNKVLTHFFGNLKHACQTNKKKGTCKVTSDAGIESVKLYDPRDWLLTMYDDGTHGDEVAGDNVYTLEEQVPYDADPGTYYATIIVTDKKGNVERKTIELRVG